MKFITFLCFWQ